MESRFPAMLRVYSGTPNPSGGTRIDPLVLWLGREFYRGMYENTRRMEPSTPTLRRNGGFQKYWNFLDISIRGRDPDLSRRFHVTSRPVKETINRPCSDHRAVFDRLGSPSESLFGVLSAVRASTLPDA
ncbi:hypothetical protein AVEN_161465-1 [Araneus ventricosus]|uniref:Uncharacterized protein n=1 Tax=Araneus ventricosus TaxID=182803 RepID=A0A4Y2IGT5_ARAVE|nr:hypothetical protein AVEN_161465-1 [Araneus ventricosus]